MNKITNQINPNKNIPKINPQMYKNAIDNWEKEMKEDLVKSKKRLRKSRRFNIWYSFIVGSLIICWEMWGISTNILYFKGWLSILLISVYIIIIGLWIYLIDTAIKNIKQMKIDDREDVLNELMKEK